MASVLRQVLSTRRHPKDQCSGQLLGPKWKRVSRLSEDGQDENDRNETDLQSYFKH